MDDIYDNLENYDDVNVIEELKSENNALKLQIEKYAKILDQLQKDFDKLSSEYKKLEINYSSLLKTARAEIERKAHLIKTLNTEKDMLVIKSFKKRGVNILKSHRSNFNERQQSKTRDTDSDKSNGRQSRVDSTDKNNRLNNPSIDTISNISTENKSISSDDKVLKNVQNNESYTNNEEDNVPKNSDEETQKKMVNKKIKSRRKSMPAASIQNKNYSSEEDVERVNIENIRKSPVRNARYDTRDYRTSTRRYHESKDSGRHSNCSDYKKSKHSDKYDPLHHFRNRYSRERHDSESSLSYNSRECNKRVLRSPPPDRYNGSKSRERRKHKKHTKDRHTHHNDSSNYKHKIQNDLDEPSSKRQKIDESFSIEKEKELCDRIQSEEFSCQSPDYLHDAHFTHHLVKEIMNTDATHLDDPRILSTKYILQTHKDKQYLSTVIGRNVNLKFLDISAWCLEEVCFSDALKIKPSIEEESRELINEIYMDVENTELKDFVESGEIVDDVVDLYTEKTDENTSNHNSIVKTQNVFDVPNPILDSNEAQKSLSSKYKIPKIKKSEKMAKQPEKVADESQNPSAKENDKMNVDTTSLELNSKWEGTSENDNQHKHLQIIDEITVSNNKQENIDNYKHSKPIIDKSIEDILATVKGDLELSDEDNVIDLQKQNIEKSAGKQLKIKIDKETDKKLKDNKEKETQKHLKIKISKENCKQITVISPDKNHIDSTNNESKSTVSTTCTIASEETVAKEYLKEDCTSTKESRDSKKRKAKKKLDSKETCTKTKESNVEEAKNTQAKDREQSIYKPNINKFSDLFGDSSSLITLDDLGIPVSNKILPDGKFPCIFENTEDAVDLSVEDITKIQGSGKVTIFDTDRNLCKDETNVNKKVLNPTGKNETETTSHMYENVKPELSMDTPNIVKTVIISTGAQPKSLSSSTSDIVATKGSLLGLEALATSTPNKASNIPYINGTSTTKDISSSINNSESQAETDVPDVRIFVRRRRKTIKKP